MFRKRAAIAGVAAMLAVSAAGCGLGRTDDADYSGAIVVGTTDKIFALDPAKSFDDGTWVVENQTYAFLLNYRPGVATAEPELADSCGYTEPTVYQCTLKSDLHFANGNPLTAASVKFSFDRMVGINDPNGPASLLNNLVRTDIRNSLTVDFTVKVPRDQTFPMILAGPAAPILDERVFPADRILGDREIVAAKPFAGPYTIASYDKNRLVEYRANPDYRGILGTPKSTIVVTKYYAGSENMKLDLQSSAIDVGYRSFSSQDIESLRHSKRVMVHEGPGGELRSIVFNLETMPGETAEQKLAVRKAIASSVDRDALAHGVYRDTYTPAYSTVPPGMAGETESYRTVYGSRPNRMAAVGFLAAAGVATPVPLSLQYNPDHYGAGSAEEYAAIKSQLESTGLFRVDLQATEWGTYNNDRTNDVYPLYQFGWFPDYPDPDDYLSPLVGPNNSLQSHFSNPAVDRMLVAEQSEPDPGKRRILLQKVQDALARDHIPLLPLLFGKRIAVAGNDINGVDDTLDASFKFRYTVLERQ